MARATKTIKAIATIDGQFSATTAKFLFALGTDGVWRVKVTNFRKDGDHVTPWAVCESPLAVLGFTAERLAGDVAFRHPGTFEGLPSLDGWGVAHEIFVTGDIGHRLRLPRPE